MIPKDKIIEFQKDKTRIYVLDLVTAKNKVLIHPSIIVDYKLSTTTTKVNVVYDYMDDSILYYTCDNDEIFETEREAYSAAIKIMDGYIKDQSTILDNMKDSLDYLIDKHNETF